MKAYFLLFIATFWMLVLAAASPLMIEQKDDFLERIKTKNMAIVFYGSNDTPEYQTFEQLIPSHNQIFEGLQFLYLPASKFKLNRQNPSLSIYRNIGSGDWQIYKGGFNPEEVEKWIKHHTTDPLPQLGIQQLESIFRNGERSFMVLNFGEFQVLRSKIYVHDFCWYNKIKCWKVEPTSPIFSTVSKLLGLPKEDYGISKLAFYNPDVEHIELYTHDVWMLRREQLLEMFEGKKGIIASESNLENGIEIQLHYDDPENRDEGL